MGIVIVFYVHCKGQDTLLHRLLGDLLDQLVQVVQVDQVDQAVLYDLQDMEEPREDNVVS